MPIVPQFHGKKFSIVLTRDEEDALHQAEVLMGTAHWRAGRLWLECAGAAEIPIPDELLSRVRRVAPELRGILGDPEYSIVLNAGDCAEVNAPARPERAGACVELASTVSSPAGNSIGVMAFPTKSSQEHPTDKLLRMV